MRILHFERRLKLGEAYTLTRQKSSDMMLAVNVTSNRMTGLGHNH